MRLNFGSLPTNGHSGRYLVVIYFKVTTEEGLSQKPGGHRLLSPLSYFSSAWLTAEPPFWVSWGKSRTKIVQPTHHLVFSATLQEKKMAPIDIHRHLLNVYGYQTVDVSSVRWWVVRFSSGDSNVKDKPRSRQLCIFL